MWIKFICCSEWMEIIQAIVVTLFADVISRDNPDITFRDHCKNYLILTFWFLFGNVYLFYFFLIVWSEKTLRASVLLFVSNLFQVFWSCGKIYVFPIVMVSIGFNPFYYLRIFFLFLLGLVQLLLHTEKIFHLFWWVSCGFFVFSHQEESM